MNLIVGLGNPGEKYSSTRHNAGFMFVDFISNHSEILKTWKFDKYTNAETASVRISESRNPQDIFILAKPQTFMNLSGKSVKSLTEHNQIETLIVAHDDLDLELGNFKIQTGTGPKVHNGISSIESSLKSKEFLRVRIGVDNRKGYRIPGETYVLENFHENENDILLDLFPKIFRQLLLILK